MDERTLYIKGYKLDRQKIRSEFPKYDDDLEDNYEFLSFTPIIDNIPEIAYKMVDSRAQPSARSTLRAFYSNSVFDHARARMNTKRLFRQSYAEKPEQESLLQTLRTTKNSYPTAVSARRSSSFSTLSNCYEDYVWNTLDLPRP
ncbi:hypothetical protein F5887DRAFT_1284036 [Amanita rubescens]|nr:hypothetical protein F5887DRAFT_1284036 [Amanita rubescens]